MGERDRIRKGGEKGREKEKERKRERKKEREREGEGCVRSSFMFIGFFVDDDRERDR